MKKKLLYLTLFLILIMSLGCSKKPEEYLTAEDVVNYFAVNGLPVGNVQIYDEITDPNELLGRQGQYTSKVNFEDERTLDEYTDPSSSDYKPNNTIEAFSSKKDMEKRLNYLNEIVTIGPFTQYVFQEDNIIIRLDHSLLPEEATKYGEILNKCVAEVNKAKESPSVTNKINKKMSRDEALRIDQEIWNKFLEAEESGKAFSSGLNLYIENKLTKKELIEICNTNSKKQIECYMFFGSEDAKITGKYAQECFGYSVAMELASDDVVRYVNGEIQNLDKARESVKLSQDLLLRAVSERLVFLENAGFSKEEITQFVSTNN